MVFDNVDLVFKTDMPFEDAIADLLNSAYRSGGITPTRRQRERHIEELSKIVGLALITGETNQLNFKMTP